MGHPFRLYGHRGAAAHHPENTELSFRAAVAAGVDAIETDVRLSSDGQVVVFHDADGTRTSGRADVLRQTRWADIRGWNAGQGEHPMLLSDLFEAFPGLFINVDLKDDDPQAAQATIDVVSRSGATDRVGLGSFHRRVARACATAGWRGQLALSPRDVAAVRLLPPVASRRVVRGNAAQIPTQGGGFRLDHPWFIDRCHQLSIRVDYWTIDDPAQAVELVHAGADGIVTNDPAAIRTALAAVSAR